MTPTVIEDLQNLIDILYDNGYFSFEETAVNYVVDLFNDIKINLPNRLHKPAPQYFDKYEKDMFYATFKKNNRTIWYVFFTKYNDNGDTIFLVHYIANNHTIAQHL
jgi:hypothetical protein